uniref:Fatty acyl-CoA reductase n=1 Tax=Kalanchoe fedtschenkoi TaxID=63787 RepID=A0A7N1A5W0_KALFE
MAEMDSILGFLENKKVLVTGATGFLAKIFIEKILRTQPNVGKLYCLMRAVDDKGANQRLQSEILEKDLFGVVKEKYGETWDALISEKIVPVAGDISCDDMGVTNPRLLEDMAKEVDIIVNLAATTNFDERYDLALGINTVGARNVMKFAKKCDKLVVYVHVSTAYVWGERAGVCPEHPFKMGETLNGAPGLDIDAEVRLAERTAKELHADPSLSDKAITLALKDLGIQRARKYGWPNTYVFTKSMAEMIVGEIKGDMPVVILRPTIITSTFKEPFSGWAEGIRTIDSLAVGYGKGRITCFLGDPLTITDVIPADMVVNSIIVAMAANANRPTHVIYQVGSSVSHPINMAALQDMGYRYFTAKPWIGKNGEPIRVGKVRVLSTMESFHRYLTVRYIIPLKGLELVNKAFCQYFHRLHSELDRKIKFVLRLIDLYGPYLFFKAVFDDLNTEKLRVAAKESYKDADIFYFDPRAVDWEEYFMNKHIPGIVKYVFK